MDENRRAFEAAYRKARSEQGDGYDLRHIGDIYKCEHAQFAWDMWQASREAVVVELPVTNLTGSIGIATRAAFEKCRAAIHAAGISTR